MYLVLFTPIAICIGLTCIFFVLEELTNKPKVLFNFFTILIFIFIASNRALSIPDTSAYATNFQNLVVNFSNIINQRFEIGFTIFSMLIKLMVNANYKLYFGIITLTNIMLISKTIKKYNSNPGVLALLFYISFYGLYFNFIVLRAGLAFSFLIYSWALFRSNKTLSIFLFILACSFHQSAIIGLFGFFVIIIDKKLTSNSYYFWLLCLSVLYFLKIDVYFYDKLIVNLVNYPTIQNHKFIIYLYNIKFIDGISFRFILNIFVAIFLVITKENKPQEYFNLLNLYMVGLTIMALFPSFMWIERITDFFISTNFLLLAISINEFKDKYIKISITLPIILLNTLFVLRIMA